MSNKTCVSCKKVKNHSEYYKSTSYKDGIFKKCKNCLNKEDKTRRDIANNFINGRVIKDIKRRCTEKNIPFDLTKDFVINKMKRGTCEVTGIPFKIIKGKNNIFAPSIDRIDPNKGYLKENCRLVIYGYNALKGRSSDEECLKIAKAIVLNL